MKLKLVISLTGILMLCGFTMKPSTDTTTGKEDNRNWVLGPFVRPEGANPVISPQPTSFYCPKIIQHRASVKGLHVSDMLRARMESR